MRWVRMVTGVVVGAAVGILVILMSPAETVCGYGSYAVDAYIDEQQWWPLPVTRCTTGTVGGPADSTWVVGWGSLLVLMLVLVLGAVLATVSVLAFRVGDDGSGSTRRRR